MRSNNITILVRGDTMHKTLKKLYRDHAHFYKLMDILEEQLDNLKFGHPEALDFLKELVRYSHDYSDGIHHPIEDQLYEMMLARTDSGRKVMEELLVQHLQIIKMNIDLRKELEKGAQASLDELKARGKEYVQRQREHMQFEEKEAFTVIRELFGEEDFKIASGAIPDVEDPLDNALMREEYPTLFSYFDQQSGAS